MGCTGTSLSYPARPCRLGGQRGSRLLIIFWICMVFAPRCLPQGGESIQRSIRGGPNATTYPGPESVHGTVINSRTHEPIARALVYTPDNRYATMTDERGHFDFKFPTAEKS